jgi:site-specific recombinase XerD
MDKSFGFFFHLKKNKSDKSKEIPIYLRLTVNGETCEISAKRKCEAVKWNVGAGRVTGWSENAKSINSYLDLLQRMVYDKRKELIDQSLPVTAENIKTLILGNEIAQHKYMLMEIFKHHNEQMKALTGKEYAPGTLERYETAYRLTQMFIESRYKITDIDITKLGYEFITEFEFWLKSSRNCNHNTTIKYLSNVRKILNRCIRNGWLLRDPFLGFKMTKREVERTALTQTELQALSSKEFATERLNAVRDIFLFSCFSGLAYADVKKLKRSEIVIGVDGEQWIISKRQKTNTAARIPLLPTALTIIERYKRHPQCENGEYVLPVLSNQKMNAYLKEIADLCGVSKTLTYHIARHTFATTVTLSNGVPIETVSKMLGHRNLKTTQHYARILDVKIGEDMKLIRAKFQ